MVNVLEALDFIRAELASVGIRAEVDPRDVNPPGAWIAVSEIQHYTVIDGAGVVAVHIYLVVPDTGVAGSITALQELLTSALRVFDPDGPTIPTTVQMPGGGNPLPAYRLSVDVQTD